MDKIDLRSIEGDPWKTSEYLREEKLRYLRLAPESKFKKTKRQRKKTDE